MSWEEAQQLAKWRREGGIWVVTMVVIGFDEEFHMAVSGRVSEKFAWGLARYRLAKEIKVSTKDIVLVDVKREG